MKWLFTLKREKYKKKYGLTKQLTYIALYANRDTTDGSKKADYRWRPFLCYPVWSYTPAAYARPRWESLSRKATLPTEGLVLIGERPNHQPFKKSITDFLLRPLPRRRWRKSIASIHWWRLCVDGESNMQPVHLSVLHKNVQGDRPSLYRFSLALIHAGRAGDLAQEVGNLDRWHRTFARANKRPTMKLS